KQLLLRNTFLGGFATLLAFSLLLVYTMRRKQRMNALLTEKTGIIQKQKIQVENAIHELQASQIQLVQAEKMAALGQLTAGVAHEINNPINFVSGSISPLKRDISEIMRLLEIYSSLDHSNYSSKLDEILKYREQFDLNFTIKEIKSLVNGIEEGSRRTAEIVKGL